MNSGTDIWMGFASTFGMLLMVLSFFLLAFYLFKKLGGGMVGKVGSSLIQVVAVHHLSPKQKLVLVKVHDQTLLLGVTADNISCLSDLGDGPGVPDTAEAELTGFARVLGRVIRQPEKRVKASNGGEGEDGE